MDNLIVAQALIMIQEMDIPLEVVLADMVDEITEEQIILLREELDS